MRAFILVFLLLGLFSCGEKSKKISTKPYFDLAGFFNKEAERLQKSNIKVSKTVSVNGKSEQKTLMIKNWKQELSAFIGSDINKAAWKGAFNISKKDDNVVYTTTNDKIGVKYVKVQATDGVVKTILIVTRTKNRLYSAVDTLTYVVDSIYEIKSNQKIRLLNQKNYQIQGKFIP